MKHGIRQHAKPQELGRKPVPFSQYSYPLLKFSRETNFTYPYQGWPSTRAGGSAA